MSGRRGKGQKRASGSEGGDGESGGGDESDGSGDACDGSGDACDVTYEIWMI